MTIDERLEYIATLQQTHDEQIGRLVEQADRTERGLEELRVVVKEMAGKMTVLTEGAETLQVTMGVLADRTIQAMDAINRLARIADNHETRIENLEGPPQ